MKSLRGFFKRHDSVKDWGMIVAATVIIIIGGAWGLRTWYSHNLEPVSQSQQITYFTVESGDPVALIGKKLNDANLIRSTRAFETYVRSNNLFSELQAGTYALSPSMSTKEIVSKLAGGEVAKNLLTILPGKRLGQIKEAFMKEGYSSAQMDAALAPANYAGHPALASLPSGASLEGYLYPDSYQKLADTPAEAIIRQSLDEMNEHLSPDIINGFKAQGLSTYEGIALSSIVLKEYSNRTDEMQIQPKIAQTFLTRIARDMALQADPTAFYAADISGQPRSLSIASPYNTYLHTGLPPGPISNITVNAMRAVAQPASGDFLYFVAGDDGTVYFSRTLEEHQANTAKYCTTACGR